MIEAIKEVLSTSPAEAKTKYSDAMVLVRLRAVFAKDHFKQVLWNAKKAVLCTSELVNVALMGGVWYVMALRGEDNG